MAELDALRSVDRMMRQPGGLPSEPPPVPLHRMSREAASSEAGRQAGP